MTEQDLTGLYDNFLQNNTEQCQLMNKTNQHKTKQKYSFPGWLPN